MSSKDIFALLQVFGEGADLCSINPDSVSLLSALCLVAVFQYDVFIDLQQTGESILHYAVMQEEETTLHMVDFIIWNM